MSICYDQNNNENRELFACDPDGDNKSCCAAGESCACNGLCVSSNPNAITPYYIHGCSEQFWDDSTCITQCDSSTGNGVKPCGYGTYCCYGMDGCDCDDETQLITLGAIEIVTTIPTNAGETMQDATSTAAALTSTTTSISSSTFVASHSTLLTASTVTASKLASTNTANPTSEPAVSSGVPVALGIGFGLGVPLLAIGCGFIWFFKRRQAWARDGESDDGELKSKVEYLQPKFRGVELNNSRRSRAIAELA